MRLFVILLFSTLSGLLSAQNSIESVLSYRLSEQEMTEVLAREDFLKTHKFNSPWLRELDFRVRSNDSEIGLEDYRLRFTLINPLEIDRNRDYRKLLLSQQVFERKKTINNVMLRRYEILLESYYLDQSRSIKENYLTNIKEIRAILMAEAFDLGDVVDLEQEITKIEFQLADIDQKASVIKRLIQAYELSDLPDWSEYSLIEISQISYMIENDLKDSVTMRMISQSQKIDHTTSIVAIKKAEAFSNIGYIQAEYDTERGKVLDDHVGFQIGISVPIFNSNKPDLQRRELELIEDMADMKQTVAIEQEQTDLEVLRIKDLISQSQMIQDKTAALNELKSMMNKTSNGLSSYKKIADYDLFLSEKASSTYADICMRYIRLLHTYGRLADEPYVNFISSALNSFEIKE